MRLRVAVAIVAFGLSACGEQRPVSSGVAGAGFSGAAATGAGAGGAAYGGAAPLPQGGARSPDLGGAAGDSAGPSGGRGIQPVGGSADGGGLTGVAARGGADSPGGATAEAGAPGSAQADPSAEVYDPDRVPRFDLELSSEALAALGRDPDTYVRATFRYESEALGDIGVRLKGEGSQRPLSQKAAFKLKFDEFVDDQSFKGLRRMTLNNMVEDPSFLAERLAYHLFRALGLPAPRCNSALLYVNQQAYGVYANVEAEDKTFLRRWFSSDAGNLYEEGREDFVPGAERVFELETNEEENDRTDLVTLIELVGSSTADDFMEHVGQKLNMQHFLRFTAAEAAVNQWDMYAYTVFYPNNFRLYHDPATARFVFLPWGMDMSMKPFRDSGKPFIDVFALARQGDRPGGPVTAGLLFRKCVASAACKSALSSALEEVSEAYDRAGLEGLAARYYEQIKPHVLADPRKEYSKEQFERGYQSLISTIRGRTAAIRDSL